MKWKNASVTLAAVGKLKNRHWLDAQQDYHTRLKRYLPLHLAEVKDAVGKAWPDSVALEREGEALLEAASGKVLVALTPEAETLTTEAWTQRLGKYLEAS